MLILASLWILGLALLVILWLNFVVSNLEERDPRSSRSPLGG
jgi:hypothetical protein